MNIGIFRLPFCNIGSIVAYCISRSLNYKIIASGDSLIEFDVLILPGVGVFENAMSYLKENNFVVQLREVFAESSNSPVLIGICLGMQLLFESSEESPGVSGLSLVEGKCLRFPDSSSHVVPHLGWNQVYCPAHQEVVLPDMYFVHSFYCAPVRLSDVLFTTDHILNFSSAIRRKNIFGFQFHPEKSGNSGYHLLDLALRIC